MTHPATINHDHAVVDAESATVGVTPPLARSLSHHPVVVALSKAARHDAPQNYRPRLPPRTFPGPHHTDP
jgi:hypothetical protein